MEKIEDFFNRLKESWSLLFFLVGFLFNFATSFYFPFKRDDVTFWLPLTSSKIFLCNDLINHWVFGLLNILQLLPYRPLALWTYYYLHNIFGLNPWGFHLFKSIFVGLSGVIVYKLSDNKSKSLFFIFNGIIWCSTIWICDWEIMSQFFMLASIYFFEMRKKHKICYPLLVLTITLGNLYKDSSKAIPVILLLFIVIKLIIDRKFDKKDILDYVIILILSATPVIVIYFTIPTIQFTFDLSNLIFFAAITVSIGNVMLIKGFTEKETELDEERYISKNLLYLIWLFTVLFLTVLIPAVEFRHVLPVIVPLILFMYIKDEKFPNKNHIALIIGLIVTWVLGILQVNFLLAASII